MLLFIGDRERRIETPEVQAHRTFGVSQSARAARRLSRMLTNIFKDGDIADRYHRELPEEIRTSLKARGIPATLIDRELLSWHGEVKIPAFDAKRGEVLAARYVLVPEDPSQPVTYRSERDEPPVIYGLDVLARRPQRVVIVEGELDALVLRARGIPAVCSTGGAGIFPGEWEELFDGIEDIFICFNRSEKSDEFAEGLQSILPRAFVAHLPADVGEGGTIADFFRLPNKETLDFEVVLAAGEGPREEIPVIAPLVPRGEKLQARAARIRKRVPLHELASQVDALHASKNRLVGHCPFKDHGCCTFEVYPENDTYRCTVCKKEGDVLQFVIDKESMTVTEALDRLERFEVTHEFHGTDL